MYYCDDCIQEHDDEHYTVGIVYLDRTRIGTDATDVHRFFIWPLAILSRPNNWPKAAHARRTNSWSSGGRCGRTALPKGCVRASLAWANWTQMASLNAFTSEKPPCPAKRRGTHPRGDLRTTEGAIGGRIHAFRHGFVVGDCRTTDGHSHRFSGLFPPSTNVMASPTTRHRGLRLRFILPLGKASDLFGLLRLLEERFHTLEITIQAGNGAIDEVEIEKCAKPFARWELMPRS